MSLRPLAPPIDYPRPTTIRLRSELHWRLVHQSKPPASVRFPCEEHRTDFGAFWVLPRRER